MKLISLDLPFISDGHRCLLACYQSTIIQGVWTLLSRGDVSTLVHSSVASPESRFVLPYNYIYIGSSSGGELFFNFRDESSFQGEVYRIHYDYLHGIQVLKADWQTGTSRGANLRQFCSPMRLRASSSILSESPLLNDNARQLSTYESLCVPYHSLRDVLRIRKELHLIDSSIIDSCAKSKAVTDLLDVYPFLTVVDCAQIGGNGFWIIANDSSTRTLECSVDSRLFYLNGVNKPRLILGRSLFSAENSLAISPPGSDLVHPSLGLVLASSTRPPYSGHTQQHAGLRLFNVDYLYTSCLYSADPVGPFSKAGQVPHKSNDLVPMLVHHLDYSQTLVFGSLIDRMSVSIIDEQQYPRVPDNDL